MPDAMERLGMAVGSLMSDNVFKNVAYKCTDGQQLMDAVDEFMQAVGVPLHSKHNVLFQGTILPPCTWDPSIRVDPPNLSQIKHARGDIPELVEGEQELLEEAEEEAEDPALKWTGK